MITTWPQLVGQLASEQAECLWQDLDGLHLAAPPQEPPRSSILWAWTPAGANGPLWRVRLDNTTCYIAEHHPHGRPGQSLAPWGEQQQIAEARHRAHQAGATDPAHLTLHRVIPNTVGCLPITFFYRAALP